MVPCTVYRRLPLNCRTHPNYKESGETPAGWGRRGGEGVFHFFSELSSSPTRPLKNFVDRNCCPLTMAPQAPQSDEAFDIMLPLFEVRWCTRGVLEGLQGFQKNLSRNEGPRVAPPHPKG